MANSEQLRRAWFARGGAKLAITVIFPSCSTTCYKNHLRQFFSNFRGVVYQFTQFSGIYT